MAVNGVQVTVVTPSVAVTVTSEAFPPAGARSDVRLMIGEVTFVRLSVALEPESDAAARSGTGAGTYTGPEAAETVVAEPKAFVAVVAPRM